MQAADGLAPGIKVHHESGLLNFWERFFLNPNGPPVTPTHRNPNQIHGYKSSHERPTRPSLPAWRRAPGDPFQLCVCGRRLFLGECFLNPNGRLATLISELKSTSHRPPLLLLSPFLPSSRHFRLHHLPRSHPPLFLVPPGEDVA